MAGSGPLTAGPRRAEDGAVLDFLLRVLVTAAGIALPTVLAYVPLPGWEDTIDPDGHVLAAAHSIVALGVNAVLLASVLVEIVAALVPRWRPLRHGAGRVTLMRVTFVVSAALVTAQALYVSWAWRSMSDTLFTPGIGPLLLDALVLASGTLLLLLAARAVSRWGTGHGLSVIAVLAALPDWLVRTELTASSGGGDPEVFARTLVITMFAAVLLVGRELRGERLPVAGLVPLFAFGWLIELLILASTFLSIELFDFLFAPTHEAIAGVAVGLSLILGWLWPHLRPVAPSATTQHRVFFCGNEIEAAELPISSCHPVSPIAATRCGILGDCSDLLAFFRA